MAIGPHVGGEVGVEVGIAVVKGETQVQQEPPQDTEQPCLVGPGEGLQVPADLGKLHVLKPALLLKH